MFISKHRRYHGSSHHARTGLCHFTMHSTRMQLQISQVLIIQSSWRQHLNWVNAPFWLISHVLCGWYNNIRQTPQYLSHGGRPCHGVTQRFTWPRVNSPWAIWQHWSLAKTTTGEYLLGAWVGSVAASWCQVAEVSYTPSTLHQHNAICQTFVNFCHAHNILWPPYSLAANWSLCDCPHATIQCDARCTFYKTPCLFSLQCRAILISLPSMTNHTEGDILHPQWRPDCLPGQWRCRAYFSGDQEWLPSHRLWANTPKAAGLKVWPCTRTTSVAGFGSVFVTLRQPCHVLTSDTIGAVLQDAILPRIWVPPWGL